MRDSAVFYKSKSPLLIGSLSKIYQTYGKRNLRFSSYGFPCQSNWFHLFRGEFAKMGDGIKSFHYQGSDLKVREIILKQNLNFFHRQVLRNRLSDAVTLTIGRVLVQIDFLMTIRWLAIRRLISDVSSW
ncbi:MAG: hypothetical protein WC865_13235 [Bacteroidales bacterium]